MLSTQHLKETVLLLPCSLPSLSAPALRLCPPLPAGLGRAHGKCPGRLPLPEGLCVPQSPFLGPIYHQTLPSCILCPLCQTRGFARAEAWSRVTDGRPVRTAPRSRHTVPMPFSQRQPRGCLSRVEAGAGRGQGRGVAQARRQGAKMAPARAGQGAARAAANRERLGAAGGGARAGPAAAAAEAAQAARAPGGGSQRRGRWHHDVVRGLHPGRDRRRQAAELGLRRVRGRYGSAGARMGVLGAEPCPLLSLRPGAGSSCR